MPNPARSGLHFENRLLRGKSAGKQLGTTEVLALERGDNVAGVRSGWLSDIFSRIGCGGEREERKRKGGWE